MPVSQAGGCGCEQGLSQTRPVCLLDRQFPENLHFTIEQQPSSGAELMIIRVNGESAMGNRSSALIAGP